MRPLHLKQRLLTILVFLLLCGAGGLAVMLAGLVPIKASSGHWAITRWILDFSKQRSVSTHSLGIEVPDLDDPALLLKGANHYEIGCVQCHGSPARPASPIAKAMTATPPPLPPRMDPEEIFYIIKHGIKFTGMPGWTAQQRDDEVWALVALLEKLPALERKEYLKLVSDPEQPLATSTPADDNPPAIPIPASVIETCSRCHGHRGLGRGTGAFPVLAGQRREYLLSSLKAFASGDRHSGIMQPVAAVLDQETLEALAEHYARLPGDGPRPDPPWEASVNRLLTNDERQTAIERGQAIARDGLPARDVPSCVDCHGPADAETSGTYPRLAGQYADYLILQLHLFRSRSRGGTSSASLMHVVADGLTDEHIRDVATYYASLTGDQSGETPARNP